MQRIGNVVLLGDQVVSNTPTQPPEITLHDGSITEGSNGSTVVLSALITMAAPSNSPVTLLFNTVEFDQSNSVNATAGEDFTAITGYVITLNPGETSKTVDIDIIADFDLEIDQVFGAQISASNVPAGTVFLKDTATYTIYNDDGALTPYTVSLSTNPSSRSELDTGDANSQSTNFDFVVDFGDVVNVDCSIDISIDPASTATPDVDFTDPSGTYTILAGNRYLYIPVDLYTHRDNINEADETIIGVIGNLYAPSGSSIQQSTATFTIIDNDDPLPIVLYSAGSVPDGDTGSVIHSNAFYARFTLPPQNAPLSNSFTFKFRTTELGTATPGVDFEPVTGRTASTSSSDTSNGVYMTWFFPIEVYGNMTQTADKTIVGEIYDIQSVDNRPYISTAQQSLTLEDVDDPYYANISAKVGYESNNRMDFAITLDKALPSGTSATFNVETFVKGVANEATPGTDYLAVSEQVVMAAGQTQITIPVTIYQDYEVDENEVLYMRITSLSSGDPRLQIGIAEAHNTINNMDSYVELNLSRGGTQYESTGYVRFNVGTSAAVAPGSYVTVKFKTLDIGSATPGVDFEPVSDYVVTLTPSAQYQSVDVTVYSDLEVETTESIHAEIYDLSTSDARVFMNTSTAISYIYNDDAWIDFDVVDIIDVNPEASENIRYGISYTGEQIQHDVLISYQTFTPSDSVPSGVNTWATPGADYTAVSGTFTFPSSTPPGTILYIAVPVIDDTESSEGVEGVALEITDLTSDDLRARMSSTADAYWVGKIYDDDINPVVLSWAPEYNKVYLTSRGSASRAVYLMSNISMSGGDGQNYNSTWTISSPNTFYTSTPNQTQVYIFPQSNSGTTTEHTYTLNVTSGGASADLVSDIVLWGRGIQKTYEAGPLYGYNYTDDEVDVSYDYTDNVVVDYMSFRSSLSSSINYIPQAVEVLYSEDNTNWTLHEILSPSRSDLTDGDAEALYLTATTRGYRYWRFRFTDPWSGSYTVVRTLNIYGTVDPYGPY